MRNVMVLIVIVLLVGSVQAGPNWKNIEQAREAKKESSKQEIEVRVQQQSGLEKLEAACKKAESDPELSLVCDEIISVYKELLENG